MYPIVLGGLDRLQFVQINQTVDYDNSQLIINIYLHTELLNECRINIQEV